MEQLNESNKKFASFLELISLFDWVIYDNNSDG